MKVKIVAVIVGLSLLMIGGGWWYSSKNYQKQNVLGVNKDKYIAFVNEVYDKIQQNYWEKITDAELSNMFLLATQKLTSKQQLTLESQDKTGIDKLIGQEFKTLGDDKKKELTAGLTDMVLANLKPFGRSRLYSQKDEISLSNTVNNINPENDLSKTLGIGKSATDMEVETAYLKKIREATTAAKIAEVKQAYKVLKNEDARKIYQISGVEPTIEYKLMSPEIFYLHMTKFSPTSLEEFARVTAKVDNKGEELDTLILDLRGNIGGAIDGLPYFLGPFIGPDSYAYQFYQQGKKEDFKTLTGWLNSLVRYKKVVILIDENSQSTAEVMAASLKKYNVGVVLGNTTKGWGTVEKVIPIDNQIASNEKFSLFLVHHITLREDGQPIEGRGVEPMISIKDVNWKKQLLQRFNEPGVVKAVEEILREK